jgi:hypothetical protein
MDWQPIETAPKDRTAVIVAAPTMDQDGYIVGEAYFDPGRNNLGDWWWAGTDYGDYHSGPMSDLDHRQPTHWMPLPEPPTP